MKLNASTSAIITGEDYNYKKPKKQQDSSKSKYEK